MTTAQLRTPKWFWIASVFLLIWNLMGILNFFQHLTITEEVLQAMPENQRVLYSDFPLWTKFAFALAVFGGTAGSLALLLKKKIAHPLFIASLVGVIAQMSHSISIAQEMGDDGNWIIIMTVLLIVIGTLAIWISKYSSQKQWLK